MSNTTLKSLYPFLHGRKQDPRALHAALGEAVKEKIVHHQSVIERFFAANGDAVIATAEAIAATYRRQGRMFTMGNGGSSCDAAHVAVEFLHPVTAGRPALTAIDLTADRTMITAVGNDVGFAHIYVRQIIAQGRAGDVLIGLSTSGNSQNLVKAFVKAKEMGMTTVGLCGMSAARWPRPASTTASWSRATRSTASRNATSPSSISLGPGSHAAGRRARLAGGKHMKYVDEFRDPEKAKVLLAEIHLLADKLRAGMNRPLQIMEVCGGHTHAIFRYGIESMLPDAIELIHGPGCPVCVLPMGRVDDCVALAELPNVIFTTFGDAMRVPGSKKRLLQAKSEGCDVRMVYSPLDALRIARTTPARKSSSSRSASRPRCPRPR